MDHDNRAPRQGWMVWFRSSRTGLVGLAALSVLLLAGVFAPLVAPHDPLAQDFRALQSPSGEHLFGTDELGRDVFSRVVFGLRLSMLTAISAGSIAAIIGVPLGPVAGFVGGRIEAVIMRVVDVVLAFPATLLAVVLVAALGGEFRARRRHRRRSASALTAVDGVDLDLFPADTLGVVGESGSGKSTLARMMMRLLDPTEGKITFDGEDITHASRRQLRPVRDRVQIVFRDPFNSLNPRLSVADNAAEPLRLRGVSPGERRHRVRDLFSEVGLGPQLLERLPSELRWPAAAGRDRAGTVGGSGRPGSRRARSALDVSKQAQILNLLWDLQARRDLAYLFISHDMPVVRYLCHRVAVMYLGRIVEVATTDEIFESPAHPYTKVMLAAIPDTDCSMSDMGQPGQAGEEAGAAMEFGGCRFMPRCSAAVDECAHTDPRLTSIKGGRQVACLVAARQDRSGEYV